MKKLLCSLALVLGSTGCIVVLGDGDHGSRSWNGWSGSDEPVTAYGRSVAEFHALELCDSTDVRVQIGAVPSLVVTCPPALEPFLHTEVKNGVLSVTRAEGAPRTRRGARIDIVIPQFDSVLVRGSGDVLVAALETPTFAVQIHGSGDVIARGHADKVDVDVLGSGDVKLFELAAREAKVRIAGSGDVELQPTDTLDIDIAGSGDVHYRGAARVTQRIAGSGDVRHD